MLNKNVFFDGMKELVIFFPNWNVKVEEEEVTRAWYEMFKKCYDLEFTGMVQGYIKNENFPPTVAGLNKYNAKNVPNPWSNIES